MLCSGTEKMAKGQRASNICTMTREGKVSLLIAEDDPHIRYLIQAAAERAGCFSPITVVADGEAALQAIRAASPADYPDLVVSDLSMPRMTGTQLIRALKSDPRTKSIPVAIITSSNVPNDREDALAAGACIFEPKPHGLEPLTNLLATIRHNCCEAAVASDYGRA